MALHMDEISFERNPSCISCGTGCGASTSRMVASKNKIREKKK
jgi:hypothetical protein